MKSIKICSFNFGNQFIKNEKSNIDKIDKLANILQLEKIDIICTQETNSKYIKRLLYNLSKYKSFGKYRFGNLFSFFKYNESNNIITTKRIIKSKTYWLPWFFMKIKDFKIAIKRKILIPRIVTIAVTDDNLCIINTHLSSGRIPSIQKRQLKKIVKLISKYSKNYEVILTGDFNMTKKDSTYKLLVKNIDLNPIKVKQFTYKNGKSCNSIDHIFISKNLIVKESGVIDSHNLSDHNILYTTINK